MNRQSYNIDEVNNTLKLVFNWFTANNLVLNPKKTKYINFSLAHTNTSIKKNVILNNESIELVETATFLGITLDSKLQWSHHIAQLAGRLSSAAYAVRRIRQLTDVDTARLVYFSYFHSVMSYGILLWGRAADIDSVFVLQKRAIRAIYKLGSRDSLRTF